MINSKNAARYNARVLQEAKDAGNQRNVEAQDDVS